MPDYTVRDSKTGRTLTIRGEGGPPTEQEMEQLFARVPARSQTQQPASATSFFGDKEASGGLNDVIAGKPMTPVRTWGDTAVDALPNAGAMIGSFAGGKLPGISAVTAGIGGMAGKGFQTLIKNVSQLPGAVSDIASNVWNGHGGATARGFYEGADDAAKETLGEGAKQGALDFVGGKIGQHVIAPIATKVASGVMKHVVRPTAEALEINPNLVSDVLEHGIQITQKGVQTAKDLTNSARAYAESLVTKQAAKPAHFITDAAGRTVRSNMVGLKGEIIDPVFNATQSIKNPGTLNTVGQIAAGRKGAETTPLRNTVDAMRENIVRDQNPNLTLEQVLDLKRGSGSAAGNLWIGDTAETGLKKQLHGDLYSALDDSLGRRIGPEWGQANAATQRKLVTQQAVEQAVNKSGVESHMPTPYDQFLLMRGLSGGDPLQVAIALSREAGRIRPLVGRMAHGLNSAGKIRPQTPVRVLDALVNEGEQDRKNRRLRKAEVDDLYSRYQQEP